MSRCSGGDVAKLLSADEIQEKGSRLKEWDLSADRTISRKFKFKDFLSALSFVNKVGELAEGMDHHPDILLHGYKFVTLTLTTHSAGGLTRMDFDLAERIDKAFLDASGAVF
jgi:4a-hydroxytetrahydrobiopterin dehydratase